MEVINTLDGQILLWIQNVLRNPVMDKLVTFYTKLGDHGMLFIATALLLMIIPSTRKIGVRAALGLAIGSLITCVFLKPFFMRPRPYLTVEGLTALVDMSSDPNSFPSGHTTAAFGTCLPVLLSVKDGRIKIAMLLIAVLMGLSRLYVGVHNPTDVLAGALIGAVGAALSMKLVRFLEKKTVWRKAKAPGKEKE